MALASIDEKLFAFYCLETFDNSFLSINPRNMKIPPFDASRHGESIKPLFVFLRLLGGELTRLNLQKKSLPGDFCPPTVQWRI